MRKRILKLVAIGFFGGMVMGNLIAYLTGGSFVNQKLLSLYGSEAGSVILQTLLSGLLGAIAMGGTEVYELERWPLALSSLTHYGMIVVTYTAIALSLGWVGGAAELLITIFIQTAAYAAIWMVIFLRYKRKVRELNELLENSNRNDPE